MALPPQQFCVRWNSYHTNLQSVFPRLLLTEQFADVTLACESRALRCHKLVLSACSAYLEKLLLQNPCKHPIVLMRDMRFSEMQALVDFMYKGEVNVTQEELPSLLKSAEALQIRGLCSSDTGNLTQETSKCDAAYAVASDALVAHAQNNHNGPSAPAPAPTTKPSPPPPANTKKRKSTDTPEVKEETVEEDGLFYGELDSEQLEYNEDDEPAKPGSSLGQTSGVRTSTEIVTRHFIDMDHGIPLNIHARPRLVGRRPNAIVNIETDVFQEKSYKQYSSQHLREALIAVKKGYSVYAASNKYGVPRKTLRNWMEKYDIKSQFSKEELALANVQCHYESGSEEERVAPPSDHNYGLPDEPPAFFIQTVAQPSLNQGAVAQPCMEVSPRVVTVSAPALNFIPISPATDPKTHHSLQPIPSENNMNKRIRRSEEELSQAADCVSRGSTFQTVSEQFNIPISTIRFFMARKGILPRRRRGRTIQPSSHNSSSPEPPYHMQHFKLPPTLAIKDEEQDTSS